MVEPKTINASLAKLLGPFGLGAALIAFAMLAPGSDGDQRWRWMPGILGALFLATATFHVIRPARVLLEADGFVFYRPKGGTVVGYELKKSYSPRPWIEPSADGTLPRTLTGSPRVIAAELNRLLSNAQRQTRSAAD